MATQIRWWWQCYPEERQWGGRGKKTWAFLHLFSGWMKAQLKISRGGGCCICTGLLLPSSLLFKDPSLLSKNLYFESFLPVPPVTPCQLSVLKYRSQLLHNKYHNCSTMNNTYYCFTLCCTFQTVFWCFTLHCRCLYGFVLHCTVPGLSCPSSPLYIWGSCYPRVTHTIHLTSAIYPKTQNTKIKKSNGLCSRL